MRNLTVNEITKVSGASNIAIDIKHNGVIYLTLDSPKDQIKFNNICFTWIGAFKGGYASDNFEAILSQIEVYNGYQIAYQPASAFVNYTLTPVK